MRRELFPLLVCFWCAVILGAIVTVSTYPKPFSFGAGAGTIGALIIAAAVTSEYRRS